MTSNSMNDTFFVAGGTLKATTPSYVKRPADDELFNAVMAGKLCYVLTPRQMGKSSLMTRTSRRLEEQGIHTASIDLAPIGAKLSAQKWYVSIISQLSRKLNLGIDGQEWCKKHEGLADFLLFSLFVEEVILKRIEGRVVIFLDEIDSTLQLNFRDDFFAGLRSIYNERANIPALERISFVLLGVASPSDLIADPVRTPFNIGHSIALQEFDFAHAKVLQEGLDATYPDQGKKILKRVFYWTNGHPYLTQKLCSEIVEKKREFWTDEDIDHLVNELFLSEQARKETNLKFVQDRLLSHKKRSALLGLYKKVLRGREKEDGQSSLQNELKLSGLVRADKNILKVRNLIYQTVFSLQWAKENTPRDWMKYATIASVALSLVLALVSLYNSYLGNLSRQYSGEVFAAQSSGERLHYLARMFALQGILTGTDYDVDARDSFYNLKWEQQIGLFTDPSISPEYKQKYFVTVIKGLYVTMANVPSGQDSTKLLTAMREGLKDVPSEESRNLQQEIGLWLAARLANDKQIAIEKYDQAIVLNDDNLSTHFERAQALLEERQYEEAFSDLDTVMALAQNISNEEYEKQIPTPTSLPTQTNTPVFTETPSRITSTATDFFELTSTPISTVGLLTATPVPSQQIVSPIPPTPIILPSATPYVVASPATDYGLRQPYRSSFFSIAYIRSSVDLLIQKARNSNGFDEFSASLPWSKYPNLESVGLLSGLIPQEQPSPQGQQNLEDKLVVVIASFDGPEDTYALRNEILDNLNTSFASDKNISILSLDEIITEAQGSAYAQELGVSNKADLVIWGWYRPTDNPNVNIHIENLNPQQLTSLSESNLFRPTSKLTDFESFVFQQKLGQETSGLISFLAGSIQYANDNYPLAITYFDKALTQTSETTTLTTQAEIYFYRAMSYYALGEFKKSIADYNEAIQFDPTYAEAYINRGIAYSSLSEYQLAIQDYDRAVLLDPNNDSTYVNRGNTYSLLANYQLAFEDYNRAIQLNPNSIEAYINRGLSYQALREYEKSIEDFNKVLQLDSTATEAYAGRASSYFALGNSDLATQDYNRVIELDPNYYVAYSLRELQVRKGCYQTFDAIGLIPENSKVTLLPNEHKFDELNRECALVEYQSSNNSVVGWVLLTDIAPIFVAFPNYLNFAPINQWDVPNITKITGIALSPEKQKIALFTLRNTEQWWLELRDAESGNLLWDVNVGKAAYNALAFSPDGSLVATGTEEGNVRIWDVENGNLIYILEGHIFPVRYVTFSPDGTMIASGGSDNTVRVWQVSDGINSSVYKIETDVRDIAWSPDSKYLAVASNYINIYNVPPRNNNPDVFYTNEGDTRDLGEVSFSPNGIFLIGAGEWLNPENNTWRFRILVWDFPYNQSAPIRIPINDAIDDVVISPDGRVLVGTYKDTGKLLLINIVDREIKGSIDIGPILYMSYSPDISTFAVVSTKTTVTIWGVSP